MNRNSRRVPPLLPVIILFCSARSHASMLEAGGPALERPVAPLNLSVTNPEKPAPTSGLLLYTGPELGAAALSPALLPASALPFYSAAFAPLPAGAQVRVQQALGQRGPQALATALHLDAASANSNGERASAADIQAASGETFDGAGKTASGFGGSFDGGDGSGGGSNNDNSGDNSGNGTPIERAYPKVVVILDTFQGPASEATVQYIEKLADLGVHVVFVTPRADKGANSAEEVLTSRLRTRSGNPVMVVSFNGSRIAMHRASRAENPKGAVEDADGFAAPTLELFDTLGEAVGTRFKLQGVANVRRGVEDNVYHYGVEFQISKKLSKARRADLIKEIVKLYNEHVAEAGLSYRFEASDGPDGKVTLFTQSTALRLNTGRIFNAIKAQYPDLRDRLKQEDVLFLADSSRAARFLSTLPGKDEIPGQGYLMHGVTNEAELAQGLFAVLHGKGLEDVKVTRNQLRSYASWLEARQRYGNPRGGGGFRLEPSVGRYQQETKFYGAILHYHLMAELYHRIRNHNFDGASLTSAMDLLDEMAKNPKAYGINIDEDMDTMRGSKRWRPFEKERLGVLKQWLANYYERNFPSYPRGVSENVVGTLINLSRDSGTNIKLFYESPATKRRYQVGVLPARGQVEKDDHGYLLVVHTYRTGKEMRQDDFEESLEVNLAMRAMLQGYAKKEADGRWTVNGEPARVMAVYHTMTRDMPSDILTPEQVEARSGEVTALIEKMLADKEFLAYWEAEQAKNQKVAVGRATHKAKQAAKPPRKKKKSS